MLRAQLARFGVGALDDEKLLGLSMDALDTADVVEEFAVATGDAATAVGSVDRHPATLPPRSDADRALQGAEGIIRLNDNGANLLREVGAGLAQVVQAGRDRRAKAKSDREMDQLNRDLLRRVKEATAAVSVVER
jgi:hypothetical protein